MRKCIRCGSEMKENCAVKVEGAVMVSFYHQMKTNYLVEEWVNLKWLSALNVARYLFTLKMLKSSNNY